MRELIEKDQRVTMIPTDYKCANKGTVIEVDNDGFKLKLDYPAEGILKNTYCEFYTNGKHGTLHFESYPKEISDDNTVYIANPAKHKFLQRRHFTRIKYINNLQISDDKNTYNILTLDISAGGMKFKTKDNIDIEGKYKVSLQLTQNNSIECFYSPIRIERNDDGFFYHSGRFEFNSNIDRMTLIQYCTKRSIEINNK